MSGVGLQSRVVGTQWPARIGRRVPAVSATKDKYVRKNSKQNKSKSKKLAKAHIPNGG
jgi:hypothetical protein